MDIHTTTAFNNSFSIFGKILSAYSNSPYCWYKSFNLVGSGSYKTLKVTSTR